MLDWRAINSRYFSFYDGMSQYEIAAGHNIKQPTISSWVTARKQVPWKRLKLLVDTHQLRWDWLLEANGSQYRENPLKMSRRSMGTFDRKGINERFLSLFSGMTQEDIGAVFSISQPPVNQWFMNVRQVPWEKLKWAVDNKGVTWEWLLEGL